MKEINIALIGVGAHALKTVIPAINNCDGLKLVALVTSKKINCLDKSLAHLAIYESIADLLNDNLVDASYISSPVDAHYQQCKLLIEGGVHVLCEKKMCVDYKKTEELFLLAEKKGVLLQEALAYIHHPQFKKIKRCIKSIGKNNLQFVNAKFTVPSFDDDNIRYIPKLGGGALNDVAIYPLSLLFSLFNESFKEQSSIVIYDKEKGIDIKGSFTCRVDGVIFSAQWAFDSSYTNCVEFVFHDHQLIVDRSFSKPLTYNTPIVKKDTIGNIEYINYQKADQFELMLKYFVNSIIEPTGFKEQLNIKKISLSVAQLLKEINHVACY